MLQPHSIVPWKGDTFHQIAPYSHRNTPSVAACSGVYRAPPLKLYRRERLTGPDCSNAGYHNPGRMAEINQPGGVVTQSAVTDLRGDTVSPILPPDQGCSFGSGSGSVCASSQKNALARVRSAGMTKRGVSANNRYYAGNKQYLQSRNRTVEQNGMHIMRQGDASSIPGTTASYANVYASNTASYCPGADPSVPGTFVPVYYHPANAKYASQGAVTAGEKILRLKYDTVTYGGQATNTPFGVLAPSNLAYALGADTWRLKDKIGAPYPCVPSFPKFGTMVCRGKGFRTG